jgi:hypothetical protein
MNKFYVKGFMSLKHPETGMLYEFCQDPSEAYGYELKGQAQIEANSMGTTRITIKSSEGKEHACGDFKIEERANQFVIYCEMPFSL